MQINLLELFCHCIGRIFIWAILNLSKLRFYWALELQFQEVEHCLNVDKYIYIFVLLWRTEAF